MHSKGRIERRWSSPFHDWTNIISTSDTFENNFRIKHSYHRAGVNKRSLSMRFRGYLGIGDAMHSKGSIDKVVFNSLMPG